MHKLMKIYLLCINFRWDQEIEPGRVRVFMEVIESLKRTAI